VDSLSIPNLPPFTSGLGTGNGNFKISTQGEKSSRLKRLREKGLISVRMKKKSASSLFNELYLMS
jgi:hypothetical protein